MQFIEGQIIHRLAPEHKTESFIPVAVERFTDGKWERLGYAGGNVATPQILTEEELKLFLASAPARRG